MRFGGASAFYAIRARKFCFGRVEHRSFLASFLYVQLWYCLWIFYGFGLLENCSPGLWPLIMSRVFWIAVLTMFSLSIGDGKNLVFPASFSHLSAEQVVKNSSTPPWSIGGLVSSPPPGSWESNLTASSNGHVKLDCDTLLHSLLPADCREAWRQIPRYDETVYSIGNRSGGMDWDVPLPMRWPSSEWIVCTQGAKILMN